MGLSMINYRTNNLDLIINFLKIIMKFYNYQYKMCLFKINSNSRK